MTKFNISQAAVVTGTSRATIQRRIKSGELSARMEGHEKIIDAVELVRVFGELKQPLDTYQEQHDVHVDTYQSSPTEQVLRERIDDLQEQVKYLQKRVENYEQKDRTIFEILRAEQRKTERLLEGPKKHQGIWSKLFGRYSQKPSEIVEHPECE